MPPHSCACRERDLMSDESSDAVHSWKKQLPVQIGLAPLVPFCKMGNRLSSVQTAPRRQES
eukprot:922814-Pleurochrysis_carterae.AAC.1